MVLMIAKNSSKTIADNTKNRNNLYLENKNSRNLLNVSHETFKVGLLNKVLITKATPSTQSGKQSSKICLETEIPEQV
jgi:hypothetical protein